MKWQMDVPNKNNKTYTYNFSRAETSHKEGSLPMLNENASNCHFDVRQEEESNIETVHFAKRLCKHILR